MSFGCRLWLYVKLTRVVPEVARPSARKHVGARGTCKSFAAVGLEPVDAIPLPSSPLMPWALTVAVQRRQSCCLSIKPVDRPGLLLFYRCCLMRLQSRSYYYRCCLVACNRSLAAGILLPSAPPPTPPPCADSYPAAAAMCACSLAAPSTRCASPSAGFRANSTCFCTATKSST